MITLIRTPDAPRETDLGNIPVSIEIDLEGATAIYAPELECEPLLYTDLEMLLAVHAAPGEWFAPAEQGRVAS